MKDCLSNFQVAGLPTNIDFLLKLANHGSFKNGEVETNFIELHKDDLFVDRNDPLSTQHAYNAAARGAAIAVACLCEKEIGAMREISSGNHSVWYAYPPFQVNHYAKRTVELEWEDGSIKGGSKLVPLHVTYLPKGKYLIETGETGSSDLETSVAHLSDSDFRVEHGSMSTNVSISVYLKDQMEHIHVWHGLCHYHFKCRKELELADVGESAYKPTPEASSHPPGTVVAPVAGLVVKVLVKDGTKVEEGLPILNLEATKMEHAVKASPAGHISGL